MGNLIIFKIVFIVKKKSIKQMGIFVGNDNHKVANRGFALTTRIPVCCCCETVDVAEKKHWLWKVLSNYATIYRDYYAIINVSFLVLFETVH